MSILCNSNFIFILAARERRCVLFSCVYRREMWNFDAWWNERYEPCVLNMPSVECVYKPEWTCVQVDSDTDLTDLTDTVIKKRKIVMSLISNPISTLMQLHFSTYLRYGDIFIADRHNEMHKWRNNELWKNNGVHRIIGTLRSVLWLECEMSAIGSKFSPRSPACDSGFLYSTFILLSSLWTLVAVIYRTGFTTAVQMT